MRCTCFVQNGVGKEIYRSDGAKKEDTKISYMLPLRGYESVGQLLWTFTSVSTLELSTDTLTTLLAAQRALDTLTSWRQLQQSLSCRLVYWQLTFDWWLCGDKVVWGESNCGTRGGFHKHYFCPICTRHSSLEMAAKSSDHPITGSILLSLDKVRTHN